MMGSQEIRDVVFSLFVMLNKETYVLFRIEFLVALVTGFFFAMFMIDIFRRHIRSTFVKAISSILDGVSDSIVLYLLGAMQTARFTNELFPVWALVLVTFRYNVDFISGYGVPDRHGRRFTEWRNVVKLLASAFLNARGSRFMLQIWSMWVLLLLKSGYRLFWAYHRALNSVWHGKSSEVVAEYMRAGPHTSNWRPGECNPNDMKGYKYLVHGETQQTIRLKKPRYVLCIDTAQSVKQARCCSCLHGLSSSLVTLDKIWGCPKNLLLTGNNNGNDPKDLSLAFALSRLLRCRLEDVTLQQEIFFINRRLVKTKIIEENTDRAFKIMELQLSFVNEYFNTRYPMVFCDGFYSLLMNLLLSVVNLAVVCWLFVDICNNFNNEPPQNHQYNPPKHNRAHVVHGLNVDTVITLLFIFFIGFKEIWEMVSYLISDWTRLLLVCSYAQQKTERIRNKCMEGTISSFFKSRITSKQWHGLIDQYVFLESFDDRPRFSNLFHKITTGMVPNKDDGAALRSAIDVPECVKREILQKLKTFDTANQPDNTNGNHEEQRHLLPKVITSLSDANRKKRYGWACFDLPTCSHVILVWHIATSLCEMRFAQDHHVDLSKPGFLDSLLSYFTSCYSSKPYLVDVDEKTKGKKKNNEKLHDKIQEMYITANSLSRYCAYLLVSKPDLIPDSFYVPKMVFQETVTRARDAILKDCDSLESRYDKLMEEGEKAIQDADGVMRKQDVVMLGAKLGKELIGQESPEECWEILSGVWVELLVHIAPTWNAEAHKQCLESGGEFITYIWALLWHCGIEKSKLWPPEDVYGNEAPGTPPQHHNVPHNRVQPAQQTCGVEEIKETGMQRSGMKQVDALERNGSIEMGQINERNSKRKHSAKSSLELGEAISEHYEEMLSTYMAGHQNGQGCNAVIRGMRNDGNTCYFNAVLQSLLALDRLRGRMLGPGTLTGNVGRELQNFFKMTTNTKDKIDALVPKKLFLHMCKRKSDFRLGVMEDSNNMLGSLLDSLKNEEPTMVESLFRSQVVKHVSTKECEHTSVSAEDLDLCLAIPPKKHASIEDCLDLYATGVIDDWHCMECSVDATAGHGSLNQEDTTVINGQPEHSLNQEDTTVINGQPEHSLNQEDTTVINGQPEHSLNQEDTTVINGQPEHSLNQEDTTVINGQPEHSDSKTYGQGESSHPANNKPSITAMTMTTTTATMTTTTTITTTAAAAAATTTITTSVTTKNQIKGKLRVLNGNADQKKGSHKEKKEEEKICRAGTVQYCIAKAAPILTIQLKRFDYSHPGEPDKLEEHVIFQDTLDITKFMHPGHLEDDEYKYRLVAVIVHSGSTLHGGHNFAYVRASQIGCQEQESRGTPTWFRASDESITEVSLKEVLECQAYILFYERVEQAKAKPVAEEHPPTSD